MSTQWVRSKWNPQATDEEKWYVVGDIEVEYYSISKDKRCWPLFHVPKSDYVPCEGPVEWERVEVRLGTYDNQYVHFYDGANHLIGDVKFQNPGYRVVSLVVERRKS